MANNGALSALDQQVLNKDTVTIADVKQFIIDAKKKREDYLNIADRSWQEIEKRNKKGKLYGGNDLDRSRRWTKFPLWWSCLKIRQPITFARTPIPVLKDTQGDDPFGRTACVIGERLTRSILKTFEAHPEFASANDDFLVTNFGWGRVFYKMTECLEEEKIRLQVIQPEPPPMQEPQMGPDGQPIEQGPPPPPGPPMFITPDGQQIDPMQNEILEDEFGPYILTGQEISVENEEVYFEAQLYSNLYVDPDARQWNKVTRLGIEYQYSYREFRDKFGQSALDKLAQNDIEEHRTGKPIIVFEYHDKFLKEVRWFAENSQDFFQPKDIAEISTQDLSEVKEGEKPGVDNSDLYGLTSFFPCTEPLLINVSTKEFWPTPEYFQVSDIIDDIHNIVGRLMLLTKAIRCRFLFDSSVKELEKLIGETGEGSGLGIPNLEEALMNNNGSLSNLVAYFPVKEMIEGLQNMYVAFQQRLDMFYQITGLSDLIRGQTNPDSDKTFGERQMEGKFALNRIEPFQRRLQEWIKDQYQLLMEMALKMFSDKSLDEYITPQTLDPEDKQRYVAALELLKANKKRRFRVDFETDSTINLNEQWKKHQATELANTLTKALESVANVAQTQPELAGTELTVLKHLIGEFSDGKLYIDEIQDSIQQIIEKVSKPKEPEFDKDRARIELDTRRLEFEEKRAMNEDKFEEMKAQYDAQLEMGKTQQTTQIAGIQAQIDQFKISSDNQIKQAQIAADAEASRAELAKEYQEINANIMSAREQLEIKKGELLIELRKIADKKEVDQFQGMIDARVVVFEEKLATAQHQLEEQYKMLDEKEKYATEERLQAEHQLQIHSTKLESLNSVIDAALKVKELHAPLEQPKATEAQAPAKPRKRTTKIIRDKEGQIDQLIHKED